MKKSDSIKNIATALVKFQTEVIDPAKDGNNPHFKSKFVELNDLLAAVRPILTKHGLAIMQEPAGNGADITITTILLHESGEWMEFEPLTLKAQKPDPQGAGSAITYGRRYALSAVLGVAWDDDDDGNAASKPKLLQKAAPQAPNNPNDQLRELMAKSKSLGLAGEDMKSILKWKYNVQSSRELTVKQVGELIQGLEHIWKSYVAYVAEETGMD